MAGEQSISDREGNLPVEPRPHKEPERSGTATPEYEALLRRYGEAMRRIDRLVDEVDDLNTRLEEAPDDDKPGTKITIGVTDLAGILNRMQAIEEELGATTTKTSGYDSSFGAGAASSKGRSRLQQSDPASAQLRLQINSLASQLARSGERLSEMNGTSIRCRSRSKRNPLTLEVLAELQSLLAPTAVLRRGLP